MAFVRRVDRPKPWLAVYQDIDGREHSRSFLRKGDAERFLTAQAHDVADGSWVNPRLGKVTVGRWGERFLATRTAMPSHERDESLFRNHIAAPLGDRPLSSLTPIGLREWIVELSAKGLAASTVIKVRQVLSLILDGAVEEGYLASNPLARVKPPPMERSTERFLSIAEVEELADAIGERWRAMVLLGAYCGLRFGEVGALLVSDIDLERGMLAVTGTLRKERGRWYRHPEPKTRAGRRTVVIPPTVAADLAAHLRGAGPDELIGLAFPAPGKGGPLNGDNWRKRVWAPAVAVSVGEPCRFHHLRHSQASLGVALGVHPKLMAARLGHASTRVTETYSHAYEGLDRRVAEVLDGLRREFLTEQGRNKRASGVVRLDDRREKSGSDLGV